MSSLAPAAAPRSIGRYRVVRVLGRGAQGTVYLAHDAQLDRDVALKAVGQGPGDAARVQRLLAEARTLGQLNHPHIATVFDALEHEGRHYVVLEYVPGETLAARLRRGGALDQATALQLALQMLDALAHAHAKNIIHRDIKPSNVMIDGAGNARLLDFGIALAAGGRDGQSGTAQYAAPEAIAAQGAGQSQDVFSTALVLYEMLVGQPAVRGDNAFEIMHKIAHLPIPAPSTLQPGIDERLDDIVLRGLCKSASDRYADAETMRQALLAYQQPAANDPAPATDRQHAIEFVLMRMRVKSSFPALSQTISTINRITASDDESMQTLAAALLKDFSLTNKLLRLVNSSSYGQFGGNISTISRAVMILGFDAVRNLAVTLILLEHLQNRQQAGQIRDQVICALFNGVMTQRLLQAAGGGDREEGFICGVFFNLGRLLASYYLHDESQDIARRTGGGAAEADAARAVLGVTYEELGIGVARSWNLPERIVHSMERYDGALKPGRGANRDSLRVAANVGDALCQVATGTDPAEKSRHLESLARRFAPRLGLSARDYATAVDGAMDAFWHESALLVRDYAASPALKNLRAWTQRSGDAAPAPAAATVEDTLATLRLDAPATSAAPEGTDPALVLTAGIQDITDSLVNGCALNDVLRMILETMYRGIGFDRVLLAMREARGPRLTGRFGFGEGSEAVVRAFAFDPGGASDVFQLAAARNLDLVITDCGADNIRARIPQWFQAQVRAGSFMVLPITIEGKCVGLFYGDRLQAGSLAIPAAALGLLKTLRNQAVLALRQR